MKLNCSIKGQDIHPSCWEEHGVHLHLAHQDHGRLIEKDVKASENAKLPKRSLKGDSFWLFWIIKLSFTSKQIVLQVKKNGILEAENKAKL